MEKCIVFTDTLMTLLTTLHGDACKRENCDRPLDYKKTYCMLVLALWFHGDVILAILVGDGQHNLRATRCELGT